MPGTPSASARTAGSSGPSPTNTAPMSERPRARSSRTARTRLMAPCQLRKAPAKIATVAAGLANGAALEHAGPEPVGVRAPLEAGDFSRRRLRRQNRGARRDDEVGALADAFPPASHRFDEERAIDERLLRAGIIDDRRIHFENGSGARRRGGEDALAAKVVVALHDDLRLQLATIRRTAPVRIQRSCWRQKGGDIAVQRTGFDAGPEGNVPHRASRARARRVRAPRGPRRPP